MRIGGLIRLDGQHALVTGGGRGIGLAVATALTAAGASVTVLGRTEATLSTAVANGHAANYAVADATDPAAVAAALKRAQGLFGDVGILVANAGGAETAPFAKTSADQFQRMFDLNVMGVVHAAQAVLGGMVSRGDGRIVAIASTAGLKGYAYVSAYCAAKHAVVGLVRSMALETATKGVTVNAVCPGYTDTDLVRESIETVMAKTGRSREEATAQFTGDAPIKRLIKPEEVAAAVLYLCSREAASVTGTTIAVAGGEL